VRVVKHGWSSAIGFVLVLVGCGATEIRSSRSQGTGGAGSNIILESYNSKSVDKIDLLLVLDNSPSMADKQDVLASAVPDLVRRLVSPNCVDVLGAPVGQTPSDPTAECPPGSVREFDPILNFHVGVITSSLGGHGTSYCEGTEAENDHAELLGSRPRGAGTVYPPGTPGFLDWKPSTNSGADVNAFYSSLQAMVRAAGSEGCGFPASLEAMYRFLADPFPPQSIVLEPCRGTAQCATPAGLDATILEQRRAFLRPDSLVVIVMVTDGNDCSIRDSDLYHYAATLNGLLPQASSVCSVNPNDPCCYSCGVVKPSNCTADPKCGPPPPPLLAIDDPPNLRCFDQKRRFGLDFLYPISRYVTALRSPKLCTTKVDLNPDGDCAARPDESPGLVDNPLILDPAYGGFLPRDPSRVHVAAIAGVPWQLIADDPADSQSLHFKVWDQMNADSTWAVILGDPANATGPVPPQDPHMVQSVDPRPGIPGPNTPPDADPINGHERNITRRDDLQYACIFPRPLTNACVNTNCDCFDSEPGENDPLCSTSGGPYEPVQYNAKAYPAGRELELIHDIGNTGIVASLCPRNLADPSAQDYGYRPAVDAIADRLKSTVGEKNCLRRKLAVAPDGTVSCTVLEATIDPAWSCDPSMNRRKPDPSLIEAARRHLAADKWCDSDPNTTYIPECSRFNVCEIMRADDSCLTTAPSPTTIGWCYVDPSANLGDPALVTKCPTNWKQRLLFFGDNTPVSSGTVLITCGNGAPVGTALNTGGTSQPL